MMLCWYIFCTQYSVESLVRKRKEARKRKVTMTRRRYTTSSTVSETTRTSFCAKIEIKLIGFKNYTKMNHIIPHLGQNKTFVTPHTGWKESKTFLFNELISGPNSGFGVLKSHKMILRSAFCIKIFNLGLFPLMYIWMMCVLFSPNAIIWQRRRWWWWWWTCVNYYVNKFWEN